MTSESVTHPARTQNEARPAPSFGFSARDLVNIAIFVVLYFVTVFAFGMLGILGPAAMAITMPLGAMAACIPFMLFLSRVKHAGMITLFGACVGCLSVLTGHALISAALTITVAVIADVIMWVGRYRSTTAAIAACTVFSVWLTGPMLPMVINRAEYLASPGMQMMGPDYVAAFDAFYTLPVLIAFEAAFLICGLLGGLIGAKALRKHFVRAGLA